MRVETARNISYRVGSSNEYKSVKTALDDLGVNKSEVQTFLDLTDTPVTYSGISEMYLKTTTSGIEFCDDIYTQTEVNTISGSLNNKIKKLIDIKPITFNCPAITIANNENIQIYRFTTNLNAKIKVYVAGISNLEGGLPASSYIQIYNETDLQVEYQANSRFVSGSPITELSLSQKDISIRATNGTGGALDMHAFITLTQE